MPRKQRHLVYEMMAIFLATFFGIFTVPALINTHDTIALVCAVGLLMIWSTWGLYFFYRLSKEINR